MIGPVFAGELIRSARRRRLHWSRWAFGALLAVQLWFSAAFAHDSASMGVSTAAAGSAAHEFVDLVVAELMVAILLAAPTFAVGAVTDEKVRGTLESLFLASVRPGAIVLGKLLARVVQGFVWSLTAWPVLAVVGMPGGVAWEFFAALAVVTLLMLIGVCSVSLLASVWSRQTRDAAIIVYALIGLAAVPVLAYLRAPGAKLAWLQPLSALDPLYVLDAARDRPDPAVLRHRLAEAALVWGFIAVCCTTLAAWRLRPAYLKQQQARPRARLIRWFHPRPKIGDTPVAWQEQFAGRRIPLPFGLVGAAALAVGWAWYVHAIGSSPDDIAESFLTAHWLVLALAAVAAGARASGMVSGERDRRTWDGLLATPLNFEQILREKREGILRSIWPYYFAFLIPGALTLSIFGALTTISAVRIADWPYFGFFSAIVLTISTLTIFLMRSLDVPIIPIGFSVLAIMASFHSGAVAFIALFGPILTAAAMYFMIGIGAWFSVRSTNSWLSLLGTMLGGLLVGTVVVVASTPLVCLSCCFSTILVWSLGEVFGRAGIFGSSNAFASVFGGIGCTVGLFWFGQQALFAAVRYLARHDRVPGGFVRMIDMDLPYKGPRIADEDNSDYVP